MLDEGKFYDAELLAERVSDEINRTVRRYIDDEEEIAKAVQATKARIILAFNEHSKAVKSLNAAERDRLERINRRILYLRAKMEKRDPAKTEELQRTFGEKFVDFHEIEASALEWAVRFIKGHSV